MGSGPWGAAKRRWFRARRRSRFSVYVKHGKMSSSSTRGGSVSSDFIGETDKAGWLNKWTNYIKGYRQRWFVLDSNAILSYYRNPQEVGQSCRGSINLQEARILSDQVTNNIVISASSQAFHLKALNDVDRQKWLSALDYSRHRAIKQAESEEDEDAALGVNDRETSRVEAITADNRDLASSFTSLQTAARMLERHGVELIRCFGDEELDKKTLTERAHLMQITTSAVLKAAEEFIEVSQKGYKRLGKVVASEQREKEMLQEQLETLAKQHSSLERAATVSSNNFNPPLSAYSDQDDDFQDAVEEWSLGSNRSRSSRSGSMPGEGDGAGAPYATQTTVTADPQWLTMARSGGVARKRRTVIPTRPDLPLNLWSIMKNCIGKDLSKIPMPVNFSEPLSVLQRITEDLEYARVLEEAANKDSLEQMCYVAAYAVSNYSTTGNRTNKPFNPLLGETFECDRVDDLGWRSVSEQVSHHPPAAAQYAEGKGWVMYQDFIMTSRFRGKYLSVIPVGMAHVQYPGTKNHYSYKKITTTVHNIIVGKLWIDNHGEMEITNHGTGERATLKFIPYSYFSREAPRRVYGVIRDASGTPKYVVQGTWDKHVDMHSVIKSTGTGEKAKVEIDENPMKRLWTVNKLPPGSDKMHNFTQFAIELNEPEEGVAPTDSRLRPDQRLMEDGKWEESNKKKLDMEDKQRTTRRRREAEMERSMEKGLAYEEYQPTWFVKTQDELTGALIHKFNGDYWSAKRSKDWSKCPEIF